AGARCAGGPVIALTGSGLRSSPDRHCYNSRTAADGRPAARRSALSRSLTRLQAILLGGVVALGLGLGAWGLFQIGSRQRLWADTYTVTAAFPQAHGVERGTTVRLLGVEVGEVAAVELPPPGAEDGKVRLRLRVGRQFQPHLRADASAELL